VVVALAAPLRVTVVPLPAGEGLIVPEIVNVGVVTTAVAVNTGTVTFAAADGYASASRTERIAGQAGRHRVATVWPNRKAVGPGAAGHAAGGGGAAQRNGRAPDPADGSGDRVGGRRRGGREEHVYQ